MDNPKPKPTCEGYGPAPLAEGDTVRLAVAVWSFIRNRYIPRGTEGVVMAVRHNPLALDLEDGQEGQEALVKFKGYAVPRSLSSALLERITPVRILSDEEATALLKS